MKKTQSPNNQKAVDFFIKTKQKIAMCIDILVEPEQLELHFFFFFFVSIVFSFLDFEFRKDDDVSVEKKSIKLRGIKEEIN